jgi:hypothetical protein
MVLLGWIVWHFSGQALTVANQTGDTELVARALLTCIVLAPVLAVIWFLYLFAGIEVAPGKMEQIIVFCYLFTGIALVGSFLPFLAFPFAPSLQQVMIRSPVGVTPGCKNYSIDSDAQSVLKELACGKRSAQWIINIGGMATPESAPLSADDGQATPSQGNVPDRATAWPIVKIQGGLVVPLYFVILSLMGAAVSMTRRVPEYQQRLIPGAPDSITKEEARQHLVFQIMQVISAPLIAIVAYHLVDPDTPKASIFLGFASGFASETILLHILAAARRFTPNAPTPAAPAVSLSASMVNFGNQAVHTISMPQAVILTNTGTARLVIAGIAHDDAFAHNLSGSSLLKPGASLAIGILFAPTATGPRTGRLTISDNAPGSPRTIVLSGIGI